MTYYSWSRVLPAVFLTAGSLSAPAAVLRVDFNHEAGGPTEPGFQPLSRDDLDLGDEWSRTDVPLIGGGSASIQVIPVGDLSLDSRDRSSTGNGEPFDLWTDFLFGNGSDAEGEGFDIVITGLPAERAFPVRVWAFDTVSTSRRGSLWNGVPYAFDGNAADPESIDQYYLDFTAVTNSSGEMRIEARVNTETGTLSTHNVFINALEIGDPFVGPTDITLSTLRIHNGIPAGGDAAVLTGVHPSPQTTFTYSLVNGEGAEDNARFAITGDRLQLAEPMSAPKGSILSIRVRATDANNQSVEKAFSLTVVKDADNDMLDDDWELTYFPSLETATAEGNNDDDLLDNLTEFHLGTNPASGDTDGDTLPDHIESGSRVYNGPQDPGTHPLLADSDHDGIPDNVEIAGQTDPNIPDMDGDGFLDGDEVARGTNPLVAASRPSDDPLEFLVAYWPLDELTGTEVLTTPELKQGLALTAHFMDSSAVVPGKFGSAIQFDGEDDLLVYMVPPTGGPLPVAQYRSWTVSMWVNAVGSGQTDRRFYSEGSTFSNTPLLNIGTHNTGADDSIDILIRGTETAGHELSSMLPLDGGGWRHIAVVMDYTNFTGTLYIDGQYDRDLAYTDPTTAGIMNTVSIGGIQRAVQSHWVAGMIDEVSVWRGPLTPAQISALASATGPLDISQTPGPEPEVFFITEVVRDPQTGNVSLTWESQAGAEYRVQFSQTLSDWQTLPGTLAGQAGTTNTIVSQGLPANGPVFLRVLRNGGN